MTYDFSILQIKCINTKRDENQRLKVTFLLIDTHSHNVDYLKIRYKHDKHLLDNTIRYQLIGAQENHDLQSELEKPYVIRSIYHELFTSM